MSHCQELRGPGILLILPRLMIMDMVITIPMTIVCFFYNVLKPNGLKLGEFPVSRSVYALLAVLAAGFENVHCRNPRRRNHSKLSLWRNALRLCDRNQSTIFPYILQFPPLSNSPYIFRHCFSWTITYAVGPRQHRFRNNLKSTGRHSKSTRSFLFRDK